MRNTAYLLGLVLMAIGAAIAFPAFFDWIHLITSGGAFNGRGGFSSQVQPTFIRFVIGGIILAAGQGLWKTARSISSQNATYNNQRYKQEYKNNTAYRGDVQVGDQYNVNQAGAVGPNAHAHDMNFNQNYAQIDSSINLLRLADELSRLQKAMMKEAIEAEHSIAIGEVAKAEKAAKAKDVSKVAEHLNSAGKWALDIASKIGVPVAVEVLKKSLGIL